MDAMRVAAHLHIPFHTIDLSKEYEREVVDYMVREYREGRTPNPDVMCNKYIKFGGLFDWAMKQGFEYVATGHYARVERCQENKEVTESHVAPCNLKHETCKLLCGIDAGKDQSYFLWTLTQRHLTHTLFPVGRFEKPYVRELAKKFDLPTAQKKDSQGVCFLGKIDMKEFLQHYISPQEGAVLDTDGRIIGTHDGAMFVTLGQRHGFEVTAHSSDTPPQYVVAKDIEHNTVTVAPHAVEEGRGVQSIYLDAVNWIGDVPPVTCMARLRYRQPLFSMILKEVSNTTATAVLDIPQDYVPVGQSLVIYDGDECCGGGVISGVYNGDTL